MRRIVSRAGLLLLFLLSACGGSGGSSNGGTGTPGPATAASYQPLYPNGPVETVGGKPVIRLFGTTWCPHSAYLADMFDSVAREYVTAGKIVAFHWQLDTGDDTLTSQVEMVVPDGEEAMFEEFSPNGSVPTIVIGGKYYRVGTAYEGASNGLILEERDLRAAIDGVIREAPAVPRVTTLSATSVSATGSILSGSVIPSGLETSAWFEYGMDPALSAPARTSLQSAGSGTAAVPVSQSIGGLADNTTYYYRLAAQNSAGTSWGSVGHFATGSNDNSGLVFNEALATILRGALIDNQAASALSIPAGYYRVQEFRNFTDTSQECITIGISRQYFELLGYVGSSLPRESEEWVFSRWDSSSYNSTGRTALVHDLHGHILSFDIRFGESCNTVVSATLDGIPIGLSTQGYIMLDLNSCGWSVETEPAWSLPMN